MVYYAQSGMDWVMFDTETGQMREIDNDMLRKIDKGVTLAHEIASSDRSLETVCYAVGVVRHGKYEVLTVLTAQGVVLASLTDKIALNKGVSEYTPDIILSVTHNESAKEFYVYAHANCIQRKERKMISVSVMRSFEVRGLEVKAGLKFWRGRLGEGVSAKDLDAPIVLTDDVELGIYPVIEKGKLVRAGEASERLIKRRMLL